MARHFRLAPVLLALTPGGLHADAQTSPALAATLVGTLDGRKLDAISARLPGADDRCVAALRRANAGPMMIGGHYATRCESADDRDGASLTVVLDALEAAPAPSGAR